MPLTERRGDAVSPSRPEDPSGGPNARRALPGCIPYPVLCAALQYGDADHSGARAAGAEPDDGQGPPVQSNAAAAAGGADAACCPYVACKGRAGAAAANT